MAEGADFRGVLLDWRGTLVVTPTYPWLVRTALARLDRPADDAAVDEVLARLRTADSSTVESSSVDTDAAAHREAYLNWFAAAGLDGELAEALYAAESDTAANPFARDVGDLLDGLRRAGVRVGVLSDIHVDLRPVFAAHRLPDGTSWADVVDVWVLSFEVGVAKPDPRIFEIALHRLGLPAEQVLMVGDRGGWDGAATDLGMTTLLLPALTHPAERRLHRVLDLVGAATARPAQDKGPLAGIGQVPVLRGSRVTLRAVQPQDEAARQAFGWHASIERGYAHAVEDRAMTADEARDWYAGQLAAAQDRTARHWVVEVDGGLVGVVFLHSVCDADRRARLAVGMFSPDLQGRGLGGEAVRLVLSHAFGDLGLHRVDLRVRASNETAVRAYRRCGFVVEGRERDSCWFEGAWHDDLIMGVLASDLLAGATPDGGSA